LRFDITYNYITTYKCNLFQKNKPRFKNLGLFGFTPPIVYINNYKNIY